MKSSIKRLYATLNGEDYGDNDCSTPDIDVEINIIQREIEAEEEATANAEADRELDNTLDTAEQVQEKIEEAEMLVSILRNYGINPLALKIISTNKLYTDIWKVGLPSTESLNINSNNQRLANQLADILEIKIQTAYEGLQELINKFNSIKNNKNPVKNMINQINKMLVISKKLSKQLFDLYDFSRRSPNAQLNNDRLKRALQSELSNKMYNGLDVESLKDTSYKFRNAAIVIQNVAVRAYNGDYTKAIEELNLILDGFFNKDKNGYAPFGNINDLDVNKESNKQISVKEFFDNCRKMGEYAYSTIPDSMQEVINFITKADDMFRKFMEKNTDKSKLTDDQTFIIKNFIKSIKVVSQMCKRKLQEFIKTCSIALQVGKKIENEFINKRNNDDELDYD